MKNILVAEDDRSLRDGLVQSMSRSGYKVQVAQSGRDALEKIEKQVFDLVIAGNRIGGADGLEILRKARSTNAGTLVIVTGENGTGAVEAMKSGAFDYLQKPLSLEAIEIPGRKKGVERVVAIEPDILAYFYRIGYAFGRILPPLAPKPVEPGGRIGPFGRIARAAFAGMERVLSFFLPERR